VPPRGVAAASAPEARSGFSPAGNEGDDDVGRVLVKVLAVVLLPPGSRQKLLTEALSSEDHLAFVRSIDDHDLATT
jgi:hypothetical protein